MDNMFGGAKEISLDERDARLAADPARRAKHIK